MKSVRESLPEAYASGLRSRARASGIRVCGDHGLARGAGIRKWCAPLSGHEERGDEHCNALHTVLSGLPEKQARNTHGATLPPLGSKAALAVQLMHT